MSFNKSRFALELLSLHTAIDMQDSDLSEEFEGNFSRIVEFYSEYINDWAHEKGFHDDEREMGTAIALMHSELSEALEAHREGIPESTKIEGFSELEEELADTVIRIMDFCEHKNYNLSYAIHAKLAYNKQRPYKHGKKF